MTSQTITLTWTDAQVFRTYQKEFNKLYEAGVFDLAHGRAILHKDKDGHIRKIDFDHTVYLDQQL